MIAVGENMKVLLKQIYALLGIGPLKAGGFLLIVIGLIALTDLNFLKGDLGVYLLPLSGLLVLSGGIKSGKKPFLISGSLMASAGIGAVLALYGNQPSVIRQIGVFLSVFSLGWFLIALIPNYSRSTNMWWALIPGGMVLGLGATFLFSNLSIYDFVLYVGTGLGLSLLIWGYTTKLVGLIIPGSLLIGICPGVFHAWSGTPNVSNGLARTGIMLVWFALGWAMIVLMSRLIIDKIIWWPLIPAGVMIMVGWGLYLGGDPQNAGSVIGNTSSVGLIIFGVYLLLLKNGIKN
jgi:hypothetical protein